MNAELNDVREYIETRIKKWERELELYHNNKELVMELKTLCHLNEARAILAFMLVCSVRYDEDETDCPT
jgi:hypothetical protein